MRSPKWTRIGSCRIRPASIGIKSRSSCVAEVFSQSKVLVLSSSETMPDLITCPRDAQLERRTAAECRIQWLQQQHPLIRADTTNSGKSNFTKDEMNKLRQLVEQRGPFGGKEGWQGIARDLGVSSSRAAVFLTQLDTSDTHAFFRQCRRTELRRLVSGRTTSARTNLANLGLPKTMPYCSRPCTDGVRTGPSSHAWSGTRSRVRSSGSIWRSHPGTRAAGGRRKRIWR